MILTKRNYLGEGYYHTFKNLVTGEIKDVETTKAQYESMAGIGGEKNNPQDDGDWKWIGSCGGTIKVDTPDNALSIGDFTQIGEEYWVCELNEIGKMSVNKYSEVEFNQKYT